MFHTYQGSKAILKYVCEQYDYTVYPQLFGFLGTMFLEIRSDEQKQVLLF